VGSPNSREGARGMRRLRAGGDCVCEAGILGLEAEVFADAAAVHGERRGMVIRRSHLHWR